MIESYKVNKIDVNLPISKRFFKPKKIFILGLILCFAGLIVEICSGLYIKKVYYEQTTYNTEPLYIKDLDLEEFKNINIEIANSDIEFIDSQKYGISICYYTNAKGYCVEYSMEDNELRVKDNLSKIDKGIYTPFYSLSAQYPPVGYVKVYIPTKNTYNEINITTLRDSDISINIADNKLKCNELNISSNTVTERFNNNVKLNNIVSQDTEITLDNVNSIIRNLTSDRLYYYNDGGKSIFENINDIDKNKIEILTNRGKVEISNMASQNIIYENFYGKSKFDNIIAKHLEINDVNGETDISKMKSYYVDYNCEGEGSSKLKNIDVNNLDLKIQGCEFKILDSTINKFNGSSTYAINLDLSNVSIAENLYVSAEEGNIKADGNFLGNTSIQLVNGDIDFITSVDETLYNYNLETYGQISINGKKYEKVYNEEEESEINIVNKQNVNLKNNIDITSESGYINLNFK